VSALEGGSGALLAEWQRRLGLKFDAKEKIALMYQIVSIKNQTTEGGKKMSTQ
jgi:hypothetical protein